MLWSRSKVVLWDSAAQCLLGYPEWRFRFQEEVPCAEVYGLAPTAQTASEHCPEKNDGFEQVCSFTASFPNFEDLQVSQRAGIYGTSSLKVILFYQMFKICCARNSNWE